jgi:putative redox protein
MKITAKWAKNMEFEGIDEHGHKITIDAKKSNGGQENGPNPKELLLMGLAGCTGMDVVSILNKMKQPLQGLSVDVSANQTKEDPIVFDNILITYKFSGDLDPDKVSHAVTLSKDKYCGVGAMLGKTAKIEIKIDIEGKK